MLSLSLAALGLLLLELPGELLQLGTGVLELPRQFLVAAHKLNIKFLKLFLFLGQLLDLLPTLLVLIFDSTLEILHGLLGVLDLAPELGHHPELVVVDGSLSGLTGTGENMWWMCRSYSFSLVSCCMFWGKLGGCILTLPDIIV